MRICRPLPMPEESSSQNSKRQDRAVNPVTLATAKATVWLFIAKTPNKEYLALPEYLFFSAQLLSLASGDHPRRRFLQLLLLSFSIVRMGLKVSFAHLKRNLSLTRDCTSCCNLVIPIINQYFSEKFTNCE